MIRQIKKYCSDESGAVTVDWVVLTAAVVGLMFSAVSVFFNGATAHADLTNQTMVERPVGSGF